MALEAQITIQAHSFEAACEALAERMQCDAELLKSQLRGCVVIKLCGSSDSHVWLQKAKP